MISEMCLDPISFGDRALVGEYAEEAVCRLFEHSGYVIVPFGIERVFERHLDIIRSVRGSTFIDFLRSFPDFVAIRTATEQDRCNEMFALEIKFRHERTLVNGEIAVRLSTDMIERYKAYWPSTMLVMVCYHKRTVLVTSVHNLQSDCIHNRRDRFFDLGRCGFQPLWQRFPGHFSQVEVERVAADVIAWADEVEADVRRKRSARKNCDF